MYRMKGEWLCQGWQQWSRGGPFFSKALIALEGDPTLQIMGAITGVLLVVFVWRRQLFT
jgi:hypothetical protein